LNGQFTPHVVILNREHIGPHGRQHRTAHDAIDPGRLEGALILIVPLWCLLIRLLKFQSLKAKQSSASVAADGTSGFRPVDIHRWIGF